MKDRPMTTRKKTIPVDGLENATAPRLGEEPRRAAEDAVPGDERDVLAQERDRLADALLRLRAEFDNYRKRAARELCDARVCAQGDLLLDLLPVLDNLERALDAAEHHEEGKVLQGVRLTRDQFVNLLAKAGVEEIPGLGAMFDPTIHEAVAVQPSELDEGLVSAVLERGYRQGVQALRPARVVVSAGPRGAASAGAADASTMAASDDAPVSESAAASVETAAAG
jgi:molecular chaperone GrpE